MFGLAALAALRFLEEMKRKSQQFQPKDVRMPTYHAKYNNILGLHLSFISALVTPCRFSPCRNGGQCFSNKSSYVCTCPDGLTGKQCEERILKGEFLWIAVCFVLE